MTATVCVRLDGAGDVLLAGPAVRAVARSTECHLLVGPAGTEVAALLPGVSGVHTWACPWIMAPAPTLDAEDVGTVISMLRRLAPERMLIFTSYHQSPLPMALLGRLAGVPFIGAISEDYAGSLLDVRHRLEEDLPEAERNLSLANECGFRLAAGQTRRLQVVDDLPDVVIPGLGHQARDYVVFHPGASVPARRPSADWSADTVRMLVRDGWHVIVTGSTDEVDLCRTVAAGGAYSVAGMLSWAQTAAVVRGAVAVVVGNTGLAHLAAAVGTPVVSLFAPTVPTTRWAPYGVASVVLGDQDAACQGTRARECPVEGHPCLSRIAAAEVLRAVRELACVTA